jgi:hypothetical protein
MGGECDSALVVGWQINEDKLKEYGAQNNVGSCGDDYFGSPAKKAKCTQCLCDVERSTDATASVAALPADEKTGCWENLPAEMDGLYIVEETIVGGCGPARYYLSFYSYKMGWSEVANLIAILADTACVARARALAIKLGADADEDYYLPCVMSVARATE